VDTADDILREACKTVEKFQERFDIPWNAFHRLKVLEPKFRGLDRKRWRAVINGDIADPRKNRQLTIDLAELINTSPRKVLQTLPYRNNEEATAFLRESDFAATAEIAASESLASDMISRAGHGLPQSAILTLVEVCERDLPHHPDEAMAPLRALVYLCSRYSNPQRLFSIFGRILEALPNHNALRTVDPVARGLIIAQLGSMLLDKANRSEASAYFDDTNVKNLLRSSKVSDALKSQMVRNFAMFNGITDRKFDRARDLIANIRDSRNAGNLRSSAISTSTMWRFEGNFGKAYESIEPHYKESGKVLFSAAEANRVAPGDLVHHFACVLRGSVARAACGETYSDLEIAKDVAAMDWITKRLPIPLENEFFQMPRKETPIISRLREIQVRCIAPKLKPIETERMFQLSQKLAAFERSNAVFF
jgi:hypothetical protein